MTVNTTNITSGPYVGTGVSDTFSYTFRVTDKTQLAVYETDAAGLRTLLTVDTDYTVAGIGNDAGGTITRVAGNLPTGYTWFIRSDYKLTQLTAFSSQGAFFPDLHENAMDKMTFLLQQMQDELGRAVRLSLEVENDGDFTIAANAADRASTFVAFNAAGDIVLLDREDGGLVSATLTESVTLTSGQTSVTFTSSVGNAIFFIIGPDADNGRLQIGVDYTVDTPSKTITLTQSYPAGTRVLLTINESVGTPAVNAEYATVAAMKAADISPGQTVQTAGYYDGWVAFLEPQGAGLYNTATLADVRVAKSDPTWVPDEFVNHTLANGVVAMLVIGDHLDLLQCGVKSDSSTDNLARIQNGLDYMREARGGGLVRLPSSVNRCRVSGKISIPERVTLDGDNKNGASWIEGTDPNNPVVSLDGLGATLNRIHTGYVSGTALAATFAVEVTANRCNITESKVFNIGSGIKITAGIFVVSDVEVTGFTIASGQGVLVDAPSTSAETGEFNNLLVEGNVAARPEAAVKLTQAAGIHLESCDLMQCNRGLFIKSAIASSRGVSSIKSSNCYFDSNVVANVEFQGDDTNRIAFADCWMSSAQYGLLVNGSTDPATIRGLQIDGGEIYDNSIQGMLFATGSTVEDLQLIGPKYAGNAEDCRIQNQSEFIISGVHTGALGGFSASATGFVIEATCSDYTLVGNRFHDITDNGTSKKRGYNSGLVTENAGVVTATPDANGNYSIAHGLVSAPTIPWVTLVGDTANEATVENLDATNIVIRIRNSTTNADVTSGSFTVRWGAIVL